MSEVLFIVEEAVDGGYTAKAQEEGIFTEAETLDGIRSNVKEVVECHFDSDKMPRLIRLHFVKEEIIAV
jgi:predicted RNase H-like HicB family nuclease